jgi:hypothetical protein
MMRRAHRPQVQCAIAVKQLYKCQYLHNQYGVLCLDNASNKLSFVNKDQPKNVWMDCQFGSSGDNGDAYLRFGPIFGPGKYVSRRHGSKEYYLDDWGPNTLHRFEFQKLENSTHYVIKDKSLDPPEDFCVFNKQVAWSVDVVMIEIRHQGPLRNAISSEQSLYSNFLECLGIGNKVLITRNGKAQLVFRSSLEDISELELLQGPTNLSFLSNERMEMHPSIPDEVLHPQFQFLFFRTSESFISRTYNEDDEKSTESLSYYISHSSNKPGERIKFKITLLSNGKCTIEEHYYNNYKRYLAWSFETQDLVSSLVPFEWTHRLSALSPEISPNDQKWTSDELSLIDFFPQKTDQPSIFEQEDSGKLLRKSIKRKTMSDLVSTSSVSK